MTTRTIRVDLLDEAWLRIDRLAAELPSQAQTVDSMVTVLLELVQKGVARPRSKEREVVIQCFGEEAVQEAISQR